MALGSTKYKKINLKIKKNTRKTEDQIEESM